MVAFKMNNESIIDLDCIEYATQKLGMNPNYPYEIVTKFKNNDSTLTSYYKTKDEADAVYHVLCEKLEAISRA